MNSSVMLDHREAIRKIAERGCVSPGSFLLIAGAGVSASAGVPLWDDIANEMLLEVYDRPAAEAKEFFKADFAKQVQEAELVAAYKGALPAEAPASVYDHVYGRPRLAKFLSRFFETTATSPTYEALASLVKDEFFSRYLTFNQDGIFERSLVQAGHSPLTFSVFSRSEDFAREVVGEGLLICNLHGVYSDPDSLRITVRDIIQPPEPDSAKATLMRESVEAAQGVIVVGYRGLDKDCWPVIRSSILCDPMKHLIWVDPGSRHPLLSERSLAGKGRTVTRLDMTADAFLVLLAEEVTKLKRQAVSSTTVRRDLPAPRAVSVSSSGSVILAGDYGVYMTKAGLGMMIQLAIPLRCQVGVDFGSDTGKPLIACQTFAPDRARFEDDPAVKRTAMRILDCMTQFPWTRPASSGDIRQLGVEIAHSQGAHDTEPYVDLLKCLEQLRATGVIGPSIESALSNLAHRPPSVSVAVDFPEGVGLGDNVPPTILAAVYLHALRCAGLDEPKDLYAADSEHLRILCGLSRAYLWSFGYKNASYLRALPTLADCVCGNSPIVAMSRLEAECSQFGEPGLDFFDVEVYARMNIELPLEKILAGQKPFNLGPDRAVDFALAYAPRTLVRGGEQGSTKSAVAQVDRLDEPTMHCLGLTTKRMYDELSNSRPNWSEVGKLMTASHYLLVALKRGNPKTNELVGRLSAVTGVLGSKTSGSGPAGGLVILYERSADFRRVRRMLIEAGYVLLAESIGDTHASISPLRIDRYESAKA